MTMKTCKKKHDQIVYDDQDGSGSCPLCEQIEINKMISDQITELHIDHLKQENELARVEFENTSLKEELDNLVRN